MHTTGQVISDSGGTARRIHHWITKGWLKPEGKGGSGTQYEWPELERLTAVYGVRLIDAGMEAEKALKVARLCAASKLSTDRDRASVRIAEGIRVVIDL